MTYTDESGAASKWGQEFLVLVRKRLVQPYGIKAKTDKLHPLILPNSGGSVELPDSICDHGIFPFF